MTYNQACRAAEKLARKIGETVAVVWADVETQYDTATEEHLDTVYYGCRVYCEVDSDGEWFQA